MTTKYYLDGPEVVLEVTGTQTTFYLHGPTLDELLSRTTGPSTQYFHQDALGSVGALTDGSGMLVNSYTYEPFGTIRQQTGALSNPWTFTGRPLDQESGLHFLRNRYYDSRTGTFLSQDPIGVQGGINLYGYVGNNPLNLTDPFGLEPGSRAPLGRFGDYIVVQGPLGPRFIDQKGQLVTWPGYQGPVGPMAVAQHIDPARTLRWSGRVASETGYPVVGRTLGIGGLVLEPGGPGRIMGLAVGGTIGAGLGRIFLGPFITPAGGGIVGGIGGGFIGGAVGSLFDLPYTGELE